MPKLKVYERARQSPKVKKDISYSIYPWAHDPYRPLISADYRMMFFIAGLPTHTNRLLLQEALNYFVRQLTESEYPIVEIQLLDHFAADEFKAHLIIPFSLLAYGAVLFGEIMRMNGQWAILKTIDGGFRVVFADYEEIPITYPRIKCRPHFASGERPVHEQICEAIALANYRSLRANRVQNSDAASFENTHYDYCANQNAVYRQSSDNIP